MDSKSPSATLGAIEHQLSQLTSLVRDINRMTPASIANSPNVERLDALSLSRHNSAENFQHLHDLKDTVTNHNDLNNDTTGHVTPWDKVLGKLDQLNLLIKANLRSKIVSDQAGLDHTSTPPQTLPARPDPSHFGFLNPYAEAGPSNVPLQFDSKVWTTSKETDMLAPSEEESAALFRSWLWSFYPTLPIASPVAVLEKYHRFYQWYRHGLDRGEPNPDSPFMAFLVLIWYTGYVNLSEKAKSRWFPARLEKSIWLRALRFRVEHYLSTISNENQNSVYTLMTAVSAHALALGGQDIMKNHMFNTINIRGGQSLGIHSERTLKDLTVDEAETRRRLWWEALTLDASVSTVSGMPVLLDERYTDTKMPSELKESCIGTQDAAEYEAHLTEHGASPDRPDDPANWQTTSVVSVYHLVARARYVLTVATKKVLKANMSAVPMTMKELKEVRQFIHKTGDEVRGIISRIQTRGIPEFDFVPPMNPSSEVDHLDVMGSPVTVDEIKYFLREENDIKSTNPIMKHHRTITIAFHKWARIMLSMSLDRLDCISYAPFLKNSKSRLWAVARNCALKSCHAYMRKFLSMAEDPELRNFRSTWVSSFHPMHATIILLIDVNDRPHSYEASRSRAMIDKMFSLISPSKLEILSHLASADVLPLKEGGEEAWIMLRKLRHKAWQNAGLDPDVLWTEEDQTLVGVGKPLHENDLFIRSLREDIILQHKQMKQQRKEQSPTPLLSVFRSSHYSTAKFQRRHPSEVTQGDRVSGSVVRGVANFDDIPLVPQILLLRARNDQEPMPYPVLERGPRHETGGYPQQRKMNNDSVAQHNDEIEILHIGELIRKIQESRRANEAEKAKPVPQMYTSLSSHPLPTTMPSTETSMTDFRTMRSAEIAAWQEVFDGHNVQSTSQSTGRDYQQDVPINEPSTPNSYHPEIASSNQLQWQNSEAFIPDLPGGPPISKSGPLQIPHSSNGVGPNPHTKYQPIYTSDFNMPNTRNTGQHTQIPPLTSQAPPSYNQTTTTTNPTANDAVDTGTAIDIDFDWNRWDEIFGQFAGFAEMLMSNEGSINEGSGDDDHTNAFGAGFH